MVDYDNPWKEILEFYLKQFLELCLPELHVAIDWSIPHQSAGQGAAAHRTN